MDMSENLLYDSCDNVQQFKVSVNPTRASDSNNLKGHYLLNPTRDSLRLLDILTFKSIHEWPYRQIRKYGRTRNIFRMEVGRRCTTGEGEFEFFTPEGATLTDLITVYTRQAREDDKKRSMEEIPRPRVGLPHPPETECVDATTPSPQVAAAPVISRRASENCKEFSDTDAHSQHQTRSSTFSHGNKKDVPRPAPRVAAPRQENGSAQVQGKVPSSDTKIYETSGGLTAPLEVPLKNELHSKLQVSLPEPDYDEKSSSLGYIEETEQEPSVEGADGGPDRRHSSGAIKEKKKSDKERKRQEKEQKAAENRRKKQQEKEQKEWEKKMKKESKGHNKLTGKMSGSEVGHIYDEPEDLMKVSKQHPPQPESDYAEATVAKLEPVSHTGGDIYSTPNKPKKDSWKKHALPEKDDIHQEDYDSIKMASESGSHAPPVPRQPQFSKGLPAADDLDETYNRLGDFPRRQFSEPPPDSIYGIASGVATVGSMHPQSSQGLACGNEYEEANDVSPALSNRRTAQTVCNEYEDTAVQQPPKRSQISIPDEGDYADVK